MNILKKTIIKENLKAEFKVVKNSLLRAGIMNPSISFKNVIGNKMYVSNGNMVTQKIENSRNIFNFSKNNFSSCKFI